jgi:parallel beta-helix repeat protein
MKNSISLTLITLLLAVPSLSAALLYVSLESTNPTPPYTNWVTAATNIQEAADAAAAGDEVVVTNGVYGTGGGRICGGEPNRVAVDKPVTVRSVNGPEATIIDGLGMRCVYLTNGAVFEGFTLTNGYAFQGGGGGVYCQSTNAFLTNCVIVDNSAGFRGGGAYGGTLSHCTLSGNHVDNGFAVFPPNSFGGGAYLCTLYDCTLTGNGAGGFGGGASGCTLYNSTVSRNGAGYEGGGASGCRLYDCTVTGNRAQHGGGASGTLYNCTLTGNSADYAGGGAWGSTLFNCTVTGNAGGGAWGSTLFNCTVTGNTGGGVIGGYWGLLAFRRWYPSTVYNSIVCYNSGGNYDTNTTLNSCCTSPLPTNGLDSITGPPLFVDYAADNLRLQSDSPCINAGNNDYVTTTFDLDGNPRISGGVVDIGAYEFVFTPGMAVGQLISWVNDSDLGTKNKQPLLATLSAALASFERGNLNAGANQLGAFQNKVRAQVSRIDAALADELINAAQQIIEEVTSH